MERAIGKFVLTCGISFLIYATLWFLFSMLSGLWR